MQNPADGEEGRGCVEPAGPAVRPSIRIAGLGTGQIESIRGRGWISTWPTQWLDLLHGSLSLSRL